MTGGRASRDKGNRAERALVRFLQDHGFAAERVPLSGSMRGRFGGDISVPILGVDRRVEVKVRANGFRELYRWGAGADLLIIRADRLEPLVVIPLRLAADIAYAAERQRMIMDNTMIATPVAAISAFHPVSGRLRCACGAAAEQALILHRQPDGAGILACKECHQEVAHIAADLEVRE